MLDLALAAGQNDLAAVRCDKLMSLFGDRLYVELQRHGMPQERHCEGALLDLAYAKGLPLVATNEPFFANEDDYEAHDALICIAEGRAGRRTRPPATHGRASLQDPRRDDGAVRRSAGSARVNSVEIAQRCAFRPRTHQPILPRFTVGAEKVDEADELRKRAEAGLERQICAARHRATARPRTNTASVSPSSSM